MGAAAFSMIFGLVLFCALATGEGGIATSDLERVATGFQFTEGPVWLPDGYLAFTDIPANAIYRLEGPEPKVLRRPSGNANGLTVDNEDRLVACEHGNRRVSLSQRDGSVVALATHWEGKRLNSPNDIVVKSDGSIYFTDPPYGVPEGDRELAFQGVYRIGPDGDLTLLADDFVKPNGLAFSPDEKVLYVDDTDRQWVRAFDVREDGLLENGRVFIPAVGRPDGMKVDTEGNVYIAATEGVWIASAEGEHLKTIAVPERPSNLAFGGPDGRTLYVTARTSVYRIAVKHHGAVMSRRLARKEP